MARDGLDKSTLLLPGSRAVDLSAAEVSIIYSALGAQRAIWVRAQRADIPGGPIHQARQVQIDEISKLLSRFM